jgi:hypothetical protein
MVIKKGANEQYDQQTLEAIEDILWQQKENEQELKQIQGKLKNVKGYSAERTIQEYNDEFRKKGLVAEGIDDYPRDQFIQLGNLKDFDSRVDKETITKRISNMIIEPVTIKENGKLVTKHALTVNGKYDGYNHAGVRIICGWTDGWYLKPIVQFTVNSSNPFDPETGKPVGDYKVRGKPEKVYTQFVPENPKERRKLLESIITESDTLPQELTKRLMYRQSDGSHGGAFTFDQFCDLTFDQLSQLQRKGYFTDSKGTLRDSDGSMVEYNRNTKRIEPIV